MQTLVMSGLLSVHRVLIFNCRPIRYEHKQPEAHELWTFSSDFARVSVAGADQKNIGLLERDCFASD